MSGRDAKPVPPLLVWNDDELTVVAAVEDLPRAVDPAALEHGAIVVHDAVGRRVLVHAERRRWKRFGFARAGPPRVVVDGVDAAPVHADRLAERLGAWLERRGDVGARGVALCELVRRAAAQRGGAG